MIFFKLFTRKWLLSTILVLIGIAGMIRLGIWQLDRLDQRRKFNARVTAQLKNPPLDLSKDTLNEDLSNMEYRSVIVRGEYDFSNQVALRNQSWNDQYGVHLITPLRIEGSDTVVMVDRGWIPADDMQPENWNKYDEPETVEVFGTIRRSQKKADFGRISDPKQAPGEKLALWNLINIDQMQAQMPYELLSIYITQKPNDHISGLPYRSEVSLDLSEGPHLGYAIQWFTFAAILGIIYLVYVNREEKKLRSVTEKNISESSIVSNYLTDQRPH